MPSNDTERNPQLNAVRWWLIAVAALVVLIIFVGGATRLTESGLSIVEWKPVTGAIPPLSQAAWEASFEAYKQIPQYRELNFGMSLDEFKTIFWWEWGHRLLGRLIGVVFLVPFLWFIWRGGLSSALKLRLLGIFLLGGLQGAIGWWMVASGLTQRVEVSQYRLAVHLMVAIFILASIYWTLRQIHPQPRERVATRAKVTAGVLLVLTLVQIYFGALVAGLRAGRVFNTWPQIDGAFIPSTSRLFYETPWWRNLFDNPLTVQFEHRMAAYALFALAVFHLIDLVMSGASKRIVNGAALLVATITIQACLGILTLLQEVPISLALTHQIVALLVLGVAIRQVGSMATQGQPETDTKLVAA